MRKLSHPDSPVTKLKLLWRHNLTEADRDYWRDQFASPTPNRQIRQQLLDKYGLALDYDTQLLRFRQWVEEEDARLDRIEFAAAQAEQDAAELQSLGLTDEQLRNALLNRMKTRALVLGDFKLAATAISLDLRVERNLLSQRRFELDERRVVALEKQSLAESAPHCLTPEVLEKIERELNLF